MPVWRKLGLIHPADMAIHPKLASHAANPLPLQLEGDLYRIFFSGRDKRNRSSIGAIDIDIVRREVVRRHSDPVFVHGPEGSFYADGVSIGNCYQAGGHTFMLFMGWQVPENAHWRGDVGRLRVNGDMSLTLHDQQPFMTTDEEDPVSLSYPWVLPARDQGYEMWYGSTVDWTSENGEMIHVIKHATSGDGHVWQRKGLAVPYALGLAQAFSRPSVVWNSDGTADMWFSYRSGNGTPYRIGYAHSSDGKSWRLALDQSGIDVSGSGWDSEMIEYPFVLEHKGQRYMFYNGNGYGRTGFGMAVLEA